MAMPFPPVQINIPPPMPWISMPARRLFWTLNGPLSTSIFVMAEDRNPDGPREPYFRQTPAGTSWHPISQEPITEEPIASLTVTEQHLDEWQDEWWTLNQEGFDEDVQPDPADIPPTFEPLVVTASGDFVTVHDFVSAVHPWLMERREQILRATNLADEDYTPPADARLLVSAGRPEMVAVEDEDEWMSSMRWVYERSQQPLPQHLQHLQQGTSTG
ncbi:hypothetical protein F5Y10DRAFT_55956 [Nemania abortiva]|nr:hypothetical protein F5Y10DRAFT_55956 [Nemania abortiva]